MTCVFRKTAKNRFFWFFVVFSPQNHQTFAFGPILGVQSAKEAYMIRFQMPKCPWNIFWYHKPPMVYLVFRKTTGFCPEITQKCSKNQFLRVFKWVFAQICNFNMIWLPPSISEGVNIYSFQFLVHRTCINPLVCRKTPYFDPKTVPKSLKSGFWSNL